MQVAGGYQKATQLELLVLGCLQHGIVRMIWILETLYSTQE